MDFLPSLGEPGILDELFWFGPLVFQLVMGVFFFWLTGTGQWMKGESIGTRIFFAGVMLFASDFLLFMVFGALISV
jgi:hypothetical protein